MTQNKFRYYFTICVISMFFTCSTLVRAATLQIDSNSATLSSGNIMTLLVSLNSEGNAINNSEGKIIFPTDLLEVISINKSNSIFSLWVEEPSYSNTTGVITFNGGIPTPGFTGVRGSVLSIVVKAKKAGQADILFSEAAVRANDGLGTDVLSSKTGKTINISKGSEVPLENPPTILTPSDISLQITSPTHPSQDSWYKDTSPIFRWKIPSGINQVQIGIDNNISSTPKVTYSPAINEKSVKDLKDGIWYFKVRAIKAGESGPVSTYISRIDSTIPKKNDVTFSYNDNNKILDINSDIVDETSGLDYYEIYINEKLIKKVPSADFVKGHYSIKFEASGDNNVKLVAVDRAGNSVDSLGTFHATGVENNIKQPELSPANNSIISISVGDYTAPFLYVSIIILSSILLLVIGAFRLGSHYSRFPGKFKTRNALVKGDNVKVLILLKKRLEKHLEILQHTRHNRVLSKEEKDIKEAIEIDLDEVDKAIEESNS